MNQGVGAQQLSRRLAAVMFTDMAGYTALMQRDEAAALLSRERHRTALDRAVSRHDGEVLQYFGDGSLCVFKSSLHAVEAAVEIQRSLEGEPPLRIGLHMGDIAYDVQGAYGDAINIAARLEALALPGGILVSEKIFDDIKSHPQLTTVPRGSVRLKNVGEAVRTFALTVDGVVAPTPSEGPPGASGTDALEAPLPPQVCRRLDERTGQLTFQKPTGTIPGRVPLVGRVREVQALRKLLEQAEARRGGTAFLRGARGVGKSRLGQEAAMYTKARGWSVLLGRAYTAERMVPFAPFSDAFLPILQGLDGDALSSLVPGGEDALYSLFPSLSPTAHRLQEAEGEPGEPRARLYWHFAGLVARLAEYKPLLLIIEDLDSADRSSLDLFHFLARQSTDKRICLIGQYTGTDQKRRRDLVEIEQSLAAMNAGSVFELEPLEVAETDEFIRRAFDIGDQDTTKLAGLIHLWTGGNPFFVTGALRGLVEAGVLRRVDGAWQGLDLDTLAVPHSLRDAVVSWMGNLSSLAWELARLIAVVGTQVTYEVLLHLTDEDAGQVSAALDELLRHQILVDFEQSFALVYDFRHQLIRETLRGELSLADRRQLHYRVATRLEAYHGDTADEHADELAYHFGQANPGDSGGRAIHYLSTAGYGALARYADREAAGYLQEALDRIEAHLPGAGSGPDGGSAAAVMAGLAKARRRLGNVKASVALGRRVLAMARADGDVLAMARGHREVGLSFMAGGRFEEAVEEFEQALASARSTDNGSLIVRILLAQGYCYHAVGWSGEAEQAVKSALALAEEFQRPELIGRVHGALLRLHIWKGQLDEVRAHAEKALVLARESGDAQVEFWSQWAMGAMEGLIGRTLEMERRIEEARRLAAKIGSPLLRLEIAELEVELAYARGEWDEGLAIGEPAIELARSLDARTVLPRLLVWVALTQLGRGNLESADRLTREAWDVSGAGHAGVAGRYMDVHTVVPAHIGRATYHLTSGDWGEAARIAEAGLAIADRTGYVVWAIHHILPIIAEASIHARNLTRAREIGARMRTEAEAVGHPLGLAWAEACDAALTWLEGGAEVGALALRRAAEALEGIPLVYDANRLRRQLAGRLAEIGDREGALAELRRVHEVFTRLGAGPELQKTIRQLRGLGAEPEG